MKFLNDFILGMNARARRFRIQSEFKAKQAEIECQVRETFEKRVAAEARKRRIK